MNLPEADQDFLRDLIKMSRQRCHHVRWVDRDGTDRVTTLTQTEVVRLNALAHKLGVGKEAALRQAAHLPAAKRPSAEVKKSSESGTSAPETESNDSVP